MKNPNFNQEIYKNLHKRHYQRRRCEFQQIVDRFITPLKTYEDFHKWMDPFLEKGFMAIEIGKSPIKYPYTDHPDYDILFTETEKTLDLLQSAQDHIKLVSQGEFKLAHLHSGKLHIIIDNYNIAQTCSGRGGIYDAFKCPNAPEMTGELESIKRLETPKNYTEMIQK